MKIRLMGASSEMQEVVELLRIMFDVHNVSKEYPNRGNNTTDARVYVDLDIPKRNDIEKDGIKIVADFRNELDAAYMVFNKDCKGISTAMASKDEPNHAYMLMFLSSSTFEESLNTEAKKIGLDIEKIKSIREQIEWDFVQEETPKC